MTCPIRPVRKWPPISSRTRSASSAPSVDAGYSMATLLRQVITAGAPPSLARLPMTPEEVAASYDELEPPDPDDRV